MERILPYPESLQQLTSTQRVLVETAALVKLGKEDFLPVNLKETDPDTATRLHFLLGLILEDPMQELLETLRDKRVEELQALQRNILDLRTYTPADLVSNEPYRDHGEPLLSWTLTLPRARFGQPVVQTPRISAKDLRNILARTM